MRKFKKIYIEITNRCNLSCSFCHKSSRDRSFMSVKNFAVIAGKVRAHTGYLALHVLGEPLLHPQLDQLLAICTDLGFRVNLTTNGTLLRACQDLLLASPSLRLINISLHSVVQKSGLELENSLTGIFAFVSAAMQTDLLVCLRLWNLLPDSVVDNIQNQQILKRIADFYSLPASLADTPTPGHGITLAPRVFLSRNPRFVWPHAQAPDLGDSGFCLGLRDHLAILVDGTVVPCCLDAEADVPLGNIFSQPLLEILEGSRATLIRQGFSRRQVVEPLCRRCSFKENF